MKFGLPAVEGRIVRPADLASLTVYAVKEAIAGTDEDGFSHDRGR